MTRRVKTVDIQCVFRDAGMAATCRADMAEPDADVPLYARSEAVLVCALELADATCADVPPPKTILTNASMSYYDAWQGGGIAADGASECASACARRAARHAQLAAPPTIHPACLPHWG